MSSRPRQGRNTVSRKHQLRAYLVLARTLSQRTYVRVTVLLLLALLVGGWWSFTRVELDARSRTVDAVWGEMESSYQPRVAAVPALVEALAELPVTPEQRTEMGQAYTAFNKRGTIDQRVVETDRLELALRTFLIANKTNPQVAGSGAYRAFASSYGSSESAINRSRARFNQVVARFNSLALGFPSRLISGFSSPERPFLSEPE